MIRFRIASREFEPSYMTSASAGADLKAREEVTLKPGERMKVPTGVWISEVEWTKVPTGKVPELQIRARSGLAFKHGLTLVNGVGTVDADFPDEICALLVNIGDKPYTVKKGDRIAQMVLNLTDRLPDLSVGGERVGGFGSTN